MGVLFTNLGDPDDVDIDDIEDEEEARAEDEDLRAAERDWWTENGF